MGNTEFSQQDCREIIEVLREKLPEVLQQETEPAVRSKIIVLLFNVTKRKRDKADFLLGILEKETDSAVVGAIAYLLSGLLLSLKPGNTANRVIGALARILSSDSYQRQPWVLIVQERIKNWESECQTRV